MTSFRILKDILKGRVRFNEPLCRHTTFAIGGPSKVWVEPKDIEDLRKALLFAKSRKLDIFIIGSGSNLLARDKGFDGIVVKLSSSRFRKAAIKGRKIRAGAGVSLSDLIRFSHRFLLGGLEEFVGIPGTVGGAVRMNAGCKKDIGDMVCSVKVMDKGGRLKTLASRSLRFGYRRSNLAQYIILEAEFVLNKISAVALEEKRRYFMHLRRRNQPLGEKSAGCIFQNPRNGRYTAAQLIELCGLKGTGCGGARISEKHANFIINAHGASSEEVLFLMDAARRKVKKKFNITLKPELVIV